MLLNERKRTAMIMVAGIMSLTGITGCGGSGGSGEGEGDYDTLLADYEALLMERDDLALQVEDLESKLADTSGVVADNSGGIDGLDTDESSDEFVSLGSKIQFENTLRYTDAYQAPNTSEVKLCDDVFIDPSNNWIIEMDGTSTRYNHPQGIVGEINIQYYDESNAIDSVFMEGELLQPFIETLQVRVTPVTYKIYVDDIWAGMCSTALIDTDTGTAILKFGVLGYNGIALTYCFYYEGEMDSTRTELIDTLVRSIKFGDAEVRTDS